MRAEADRMVRERCRGDGDEEEAWYFYDEVREREAYEFDELVERSARWKARQAVRFRD